MLPPAYVAEFSGNKLVNVCVAFIPVQIFFVVLRYISRYLGKVPMGIDDWLILPSLASNLILNSVTIGKIISHYKESYSTLTNWF